mgnify:FL=1
MKNRAAGGALIAVGEGVGAATGEMIGEEVTSTANKALRSAEDFFRGESL